MKIQKLSIKNYRTLEDITFSFPTPYVSICGANDSGKTNVVRAMRALMKSESEFVRFHGEEQELSLKEDFPKWKSQSSTSESISISITLTIDKQRDAGFYRFVRRQLELSDESEHLNLVLETEYRGEKIKAEVHVSGRRYGGIDAEEVLSKLQSSRSILFHNSTESYPSFFYRVGLGSLVSLSPENEPALDTLRKSVNKGLGKLAKGKEKEFEQLLGRLEGRYRVSLSLPTLDFSDIPYSINLGESKYDVPLNDWGSGTKNRTLILLTLFRAQQISESEESASKTTPVIIVEEPESFLHPSAQAEFGRILSEIANEFDVQVIVTTHSPYLMNLKNPDSNLLLEREMYYKQRRKTILKNTSSDNWMEPFGQALGLSNSEFEPWRPLFQSSSKSLLLVEGKIDKLYFELLRDIDHGENRLNFEGDVFSYDGADTMKNTVLLRFVLRLHRAYVTFDLDAKEKIAKTLESLGLILKKDYLPVGKDKPGKTCIEGLVPDSITSRVYSQNAALVTASMSGDSKERKSAHSKLKKLIFEEFKESAVPGDEYFGEFYKVTKVINKALAA